MRKTNRLFKHGLLPLCFLCILNAGFTVLAREQPSQIKPDAHYALTIDKKNSLMAVELCIHSNIPRYLTNSNRREARQVNYVKQGDTMLFPNGTKVYPKAENDRCFTYEVSTKSSNRLQSDSHVYRSLVINTQRWLWYHPNFQYIGIDVQDKKGKPLSAFFPFVEAGELYDIGNKGLEWESKTIIDQVKSFRLPVGSSYLEVAISGVAQVRAHDWLNWIKRTAAAVQSIYGAYPVNGTKVLVLPIGQRSGPIPWGEVQRGGFPSVHFYIDETRSNSEFLSDWTGSHELSHVFLPKVAGGDRWMSEGIASYYQNIARARHGLLPSATAWRKITEGFARGRSAAGTTPLRKASKIMHVYWGGVAYFFLADLRLREAGTSLPEVLHKFHQCCLPSFKQWNAESLANKFNELSGTTIFSDLLRNEANARQFPVSATFDNAVTNQLVQRHLPEILKSPEN